MKIQYCLDSRFVPWINAKMTSHGMSVGVENWIKFTSTQAGRDKLYRLIQYASRFVAYHLKNAGVTTDLAARISKLSIAVGLARKLFRAGKPVDFAKSLIKALEIKDNTIKWGTVGKCTGYGAWLVLDTIQWLQSVGVLSLNAKTMNAINEQAPRFWLFGILSSLVVNLHRIQKTFSERQSQLHFLVKGAPGALTAETLWDGEMRTTTKDALQDMIDLIIPLSLMGWLKVSPGTVGLAGTVTSLMGAASLYPSSSPK